MFSQSSLNTETFWQQGTLWMGFQDRRYPYIIQFTNWMPFNWQYGKQPQPFSLPTPPPWFDITILLMIVALQYLHFILLVPTIIVKRGHGCHIWGRLYTGLSGLWYHILQKDHLPSPTFGGVLLQNYDFKGIIFSITSIFWYTPSSSVWWNQLQYRFNSNIFINFG